MPSVKLNCTGTAVITLRSGQLRNRPLTLANTQKQSRKETLMNLFKTYVNIIGHRSPLRLVRQSHRLMASVVQRDAQGVVHVIMMRFLVFLLLSKEHHATDSWAVLFRECQQFSYAACQFLDTILSDWHSRHDCSERHFNVSGLSSTCRQVIWLTPRWDLCPIMVSAPINYLQVFITRNHLYEPMWITKSVCGALPNTIPLLPSNIEFSPRMIRATHGHAKNH